MVVMMMIVLIITQHNNTYTSLYILYMFVCVHKSTHLHRISFEAFVQVFFFLLYAFILFTTLLRYPFCFHPILINIIFTSTFFFSIYSYLNSETHAFPLYSICSSYVYLCALCCGRLNTLCSLHHIYM